MRDSVANILRIFEAWKGLHVIFPFNSNVRHHELFQTLNATRFSKRFLNVIFFHFLKVVGFWSSVKFLYPVGYYAWCWKLWQNVSICSMVQILVTFNINFKWMDHPLYGFWIESSGKWEGGEIKLDINFECQVEVFHSTFILLYSPTWTNI